MNKFKLWFSRNEFRIILTVIACLGFFLMTKGLNNYYKIESENRKIIEKSQENKDKENENNRIITDKNESEIISQFTEIENTSSEYKKIETIVKKFINSIYLASVNDNIDLKDNVYNMCSYELIEHLYNVGQSVTEDNIINFIFSVKNVNEYSVEKVYEYNKNNNVSQYVITMKYSGDNEETDFYILMNIDDNNKTFEYDGNIMVLNYLDTNKKVEAVENRKSNIF